MDYNKEFYDLVKKYTTDEKLSYRNRDYFRLDKFFLLKELGRVNNDEYFRRAIIDLRNENLIDTVNTIHNKDRLIWVRFI